MTGWTVYSGMLLLVTVDVMVQLTIPLDAGNSSTRIWLLVLYSAVKMSLTRGQSAWATFKVQIQPFLIYTVSSSETTRGTFQTKNKSKEKSNDKIRNNPTLTEFHLWLVGATDGDGTFHFAKTKAGKWGLYYKVAQSTYNLRFLYHIKKMLGVGQVSISGTDGEFRIRDMKVIVRHILPIFDKYPLLTSKYFNYDLFKQAAMIMTDSLLSKEKKDSLLTELKLRKMPLNYLSPAWFKMNEENMTVAQAGSVITKAWLVGFTEAEGSFYISKCGIGRIRHYFEITQHLSESTLMKAIGLVLNIGIHFKNTYITVKTQNETDNLKIHTYFFNTMKGMKSLEYRIWARSFNKKMTGIKRYEYLLAVQAQMRHIRSIRMDKNFKITRRGTPSRFIK